VSDALVELTDIAPTLLAEAGTPAPARMQGRSLAALLRGDAEPGRHRDFVRSEFFHALSPVGRTHIHGTYATMYRDRRHKLCVYHGLDAGELFDLETDPGEFDNLWDDDDAQGLRFDLMKRSFDALAFAADIGTPHVTQF
jgi:arylsulfatase A-like enzyme